MTIFGVSGYYIPDTLFNHNTLNNFDIKINSSAIVLLNEHQQISINDSTNRISYAFDDVKYKTKLEKFGKTYCTKIIGNELDMNVVFWKKQDFDSFKILYDFIGLTIKDKSDEYIKFNIKYDNNKIDVYFYDDPNIELSIIDNGIILNGETYTSSFTKTFNNIIISSDDPQNAIARHKGIKLINEEDNKVLSQYYYRFDLNALKLYKKQIKLSDEEYNVGEYGSVYNKIVGTNVFTNIIETTDSFGRFLSNKDSVFVSEYNDNIIDVFKMQELNDVNTDGDDIGINGIYNYGYFLSGDKILPTYVYVGSSYIYITYSRAKGDYNSCVDGDYKGTESVLKLKIKKDSIEVKTNNLSFFKLLHSDEEFCLKLYRAIRKGVGIFKTPFTIKKYKDKTDIIEVQYNYTNSNNNTTTIIEDQTTRWKITTTIKTDGEERSSHKYLYRYRDYEQIELSDGSTINMGKKRFFDIISDNNETVITADNTYIEPYSGVTKDNIIYFNPYNISYKFGRSKLSDNILSKLIIKTEDGYDEWEISYQSFTQALLSKNTSTDENKSIDEFVKLFNSSNSKFAASFSCGYSILKYVDENGNNVEVQFPLSTFFVETLYSTKHGVFKKVYFSNSLSTGVYITKKYEIIK